MNQHSIPITTYVAGAAQASMHRNLQKICDSILEPYGISKMQWLIIGCIYDAGSAGIRTSDLARKLDTTISYLTTSINLLVSKGILVRTENDNDFRSRMISVTPSFAAKCDEIEQTLRDGLRQTIYATVDPADFKVYMKVLFQLRDAGYGDVEPDTGPSK